MADNSQNMVKYVPIGSGVARLMDVRVCERMVEDGILERSFDCNGEPIYVISRAARDELYGDDDAS